jgi:hypothetical protein
MEELKVTFVVVGLMGNLTERENGCRRFRPFLDDTKVKNRTLPISLIRPSVDAINDTRYQHLKTNLLKVDGLLLKPTVYPSTGSGRTEVC